MVCVDSIDAVNSCTQPMPPVSRQKECIVDIRLLGPLTAELNGVSILPTAAKPRQVFALLALRANNVVPVSDLFEEIWGYRPPKSMSTTLQTYILHIRRVINDVLKRSPGAATDSIDAKELLATCNNGYVLKTVTDEVDSKKFERLTRAGCQAIENNDAENGSDLISQGLALWRGNMLADLHVGPILAVESARFEEYRLIALERHITADLAMGHYMQVLDELYTLTARNPLHERFHAQFMIALCWSGQVSKALGTFQRLRSALVEELGIEPSPALQNLHSAILVSDPELQYPGSGLRTITQLLSGQKS